MNRLWRFLGRKDIQEGERLPDRWLAWGTRAARTRYFMLRLPSWQYQYAFDIDSPAWHQRVLLWHRGRLHVPLIRVFD